MQFGSRSVGILHRQCGERAKPCGSGCYLLGQYVVGAASDIDRLGGVGDSLYCRSIERKNGEANTAGVHTFEAFGLKV
jgi:hypothetical protein